jgi:hypothetical protein
MAVEWLAPVDALPDEDRVAAVSYLEGQCRIDLALWVGYRFGPKGSVDHELVLRLRGPRPGRVGVAALSAGVGRELPTRCYVGFPTRATLREARPVAELVWERRGAAAEGADPLDFRLVFAPVDTSPDLRAAVAAAAAEVPVVRRVRRARSTLLKSGRNVQQSVQAMIEYDEPWTDLGNVVGTVSDLLRPHFVTDFGVTAGTWPYRVSTTTIYSRRSRAVA